MIASCFSILFLNSSYARHFDIIKIIIEKSKINIAGFSLNEEILI